MKNINKLKDFKYFRDISISFFTFICGISVAVGLQMGPPSIVETFTSPAYVQMWALVLIVGCLLNLIGNTLKYLDSDKFIYFEYPGSIMISLMAWVYAGAYAYHLGIMSLAGIGFFVGLGFYFFVRFIEITVKIRKANKS